MSEGVEGATLWGRACRRCGWGGLALRSHKPRLDPALLCTFDILFIIVVLH